jgi:hypothetical protein
VDSATSGNAAEAAVLRALIDRGLHVLVPFGGGHPFDLVVHIPDGLFLRIQCKSARPRRGCMLFNARTTDHGRGRLPYVGLADMFGVYFPPKDSVYLVPVVAITGYVPTFRLQPTRNNQRKRVRYAADYEIERWGDDELRQIAVEAASQLAGSTLRRAA